METGMGQVLVRNLEDEVIETLKRKAASGGISLEEQVRQILRGATRPSKGDLLEELRVIRAMTPPGPRRLAEDIIREIRDNE
jgi:plasmid stability protein